MDHYSNKQTSDNDTKLENLLKQKGALDEQRGVIDEQRGVIDEQIRSLKFASQSTSSPQTQLQLQDRTQPEPQVDSHGHGHTQSQDVVAMTITESNAGQHRNGIQPSAFSNGVDFIPQYHKEVSAPKRPRTYSQPAASHVTMSRSRSNHSSVSAPFFSLPGVPSISSVADVARAYSAIRTSSQDGMNSDVLQRWQQAPQPFCASILEFPAFTTPRKPCSQAMSIEDYLAKQDADTNAGDLVPPTQIVTHSTSAYDPPLSQDFAPFQKTPISRANSHASYQDTTSVSGFMSNIRLESIASNSGDIDRPRKVFPRKPNRDDQDLPDSQGMPCSDMIATSDSGDVVDDAVGPKAASQAMSRSGTNSSFRSNSSRLSLRAKETLERHIQNGRTADIQPKPLSIPPQAGQSPVRVEKPPYHRRPHPRVFCNKCDDYPEGFRGEHELRRHCESKHYKKVKRWMCVDASLNNSSSLRPEVPIAKCKACKSGKLYNVYYNAGAHLRRAHFNPKSRRGGRTQGPDRGRSSPSGQEWPPMEELKKWFKSIVVPRNGMTGTASQVSIEDPQRREEDIPAINTPQDAFIPDGTDMDFAKIGMGMQDTGAGSFANSSPNFTLSPYAPELNVDTMGLPDLTGTSPTSLSSTFNDLVAASSPSAFPTSQDVFSPSTPDLSLFGDILKSINSGMSENLGLATTSPVASFNDVWGTMGDEGHAFVDEQGTSLLS